MDSGGLVSEDRENFGKDSHWQVVRANKADSRDWLSDAPVCSQLTTHSIAHIGLMWAQKSFEVMRAEASGTFALIGLDGEGETLIDGHWRTVRAGQICLLPAFAPTGIRVKDGSWNFAWVRYQETYDSCPIISSNSPVIQSGNGLPLKHSIAGLFSEYAGEINEAATTHHWVELIHGFVERSARPYQGDDRLWRIWCEVEKDLARSWSLADLANIGSISQEHLRRLCQQQLGRSPIQQITYLRMREAVSLLATSDDKVETVARAVGYENPFTFSNAFKRWTGKRPSDFQK